MKYDKRLQIDGSLSRLHASFNKVFVSLSFLVQSVSPEASDWCLIFAGADGCLVFVNNQHGFICLESGIRFPVALSILYHFRITPKFKSDFWRANLWTPSPWASRRCGRPKHANHAKNEGRRPVFEGGKVCLCAQLVYIYSKPKRVGVVLSGSYSQSGMIHWFSSCWISEWEDTKM